MHILVTGAAGMIGRKLTARLVKDGGLNGKSIDRLTLIDVVAPEKPAGFSGAVELSASDLSAPDVAAKTVAGKPELVFHLAGVVSGEAETDFEKGYRVNLDGTRALLEAIRAAAYKPKVIFTSSIAVYGAPFPHAIPDEFHLTPLTSYGTQKAICELLLADYTRRGFLDGVGIRLPTICVRPGKPNKAASGFFSGIIREPLAGPGGAVAGPREGAAYACQPARRGRLSHSRRGPDAANNSARASILPMPGVCCTVAEQIEALRRVAGPRGRRAHPPRAGRTGATDRRGWSERLDAKRGHASWALRPKPTFDDDHRAHIEDELGGKIA